MKFSKLALFIGVAAIFISCMVVVNIKYDRLSRYPYEDEEARKLIDRYMNDEEIEFLIEYSIDPTYFIKYIECPGFNIYHVEFYDLAKQYLWYSDNSEIVNIVEEIIGRYEVEECETMINKLVYYSCDELLYYVINGDEYIEGARLADYPDGYNVVIDNEHTLSIHKPDDLVTIDGTVLRRNASNAFEEMMNEVNEINDSNNFGGIEIMNSYLSYEELKGINAENSSVIPGHNIHQTGLCIDLNLSDSVYKDEERLKEFKDITRKYGFITEKCELSEFHLQYNGVNND